MANEKTVLKRFANLDIDGVDKPKRARPKRPPAEPPTGLATRSSQAPAPRRRPGRATPQPQQPRPAAPYRETIMASPRASDPAPRRRIDSLPQSVRNRAQSIRERGPIDRGQPLEVPLGGGRIMTVEMNLRQPRPEPAHAPVPMIPGAATEEAFLASLPMRLAAAAASTPTRAATPSRGTSVRSSLRARAPRASVMNSPDAPVTITEMAARQLRLVAHQAGLGDAALRLLTSGSGGPAQCDFALETAPPGPDDAVFLSQGIRLIVDHESLRSLEGTRITCADLMV
ncbi:MAG: Fe-S cluster assembly iron-binding protein IscA [Myxococcota bacterium]|jgi:Fe-S cluster assembly iron-binding protein IscA